MFITAIGAQALTALAEDDINGLLWLWKFWTQDHKITTN